MTPSTGLDRHSLRERRVSLQLGVPDDRPLFTVADRTYVWEEALFAAELRGELGVLERQTRQGLACVQRLVAEAGTLDAESVRVAAATFRHERNLLAADELRGWLAARGLTASDWDGYLRRLLLRERWIAELERIELAFVVGDEEVEAALAAEAVCTGFLGRVAERLAEDAALAAANGPADGSSDRTAFITSLIGRAEEVRARSPSRAEVEREIAAHALDWIRIEAETLELVEAEAAREAALCVRVDGRSLTDVAGDCGVPANALIIYLADADAELRAALLSARPGELVGPLERGGGQMLLQVRAKAEPSGADPELGRRAVAVLAARALERELRERVLWHERP